jgi:hypothetical protein
MDHSEPRAADSARIRTKGRAGPAREGIPSSPARPSAGRADSLRVRPHRAAAPSVHAFIALIPYAIRTSRPSDGPRPPRAAPRRVRPVDPTMDHAERRAADSAQIRTKGRAGPAREGIPSSPARPSAGRADSLRVRPYGAAAPSVHAFIARIPQGDSNSQRSDNLGNHNQDVDPSTDLRSASSNNSSHRSHTVR